MSKAKITFGTNKDPGHVVECDDSLAEIHRILEEGFNTTSSNTGRKFWLAVVETDNFRLIFDRVAIRDGKWSLRPSQR